MWDLFFCNIFIEIIQWSILYDIFTSKAWDDFKEKNYRNIRPIVFNNIQKFILCKEKKLGGAILSCPKDSCTCSKKIAFTCKCRFCSSCWKIASDNWMNKVISWAIPDVTYKHIVFTLPKEFKLFLAKYRKTLDLLFKASSKALRNCNEIN